MISTRDLFFDSAFASSQWNNDPAQSTFDLPGTLTNVVSISLSSFQLPILFPSVRSPLNTLDVTYGATRATFTLTPKNYTRTSDLLTDLNTLTDTTCIWTIATSGAVSAAPFNGATALTIHPTHFSHYFLGMGPVALTGGTVTGPSFYNLNVDNFFSVEILGIPLPGTPNHNGLRGTFRVLGSGVQGTIVMHSESNSFRQRALCTQSGFTLNQLRVNLFDRFGNPLPGKADFSFSLRVEQAL
jgi:hypothetical protein